MYVNMDEKEYKKLQLEEQHPVIISRGEEFHLDSYTRTGIKPFVRYVCNVDSFAKAVLEENKRLNIGITDKKGCMMTAVFTTDGGIFYTNDMLRDEQNQWVFKRRFTTLWSKIGNYDGKKVDHRKLLDFLESVKANVIGFEDLYHALSKLRISKRVQFSSNPVYNGEEVSGAYEFSYSFATGSKVVAVCPAKINFKGRLVRGSSTEYEFSMNLSPAPDEENGKIDFSLNMPGYDFVLDQICEDDYDNFTHQVKDLTELLILRDW